MAIGRKIVSLRKKYNMTQEKLAESIGVSRQTLSNWESDITSPDLQTASLLSNIFKVSLDELADNNLEIDCKNNYENKLLNNLLDKNVYLYLSDFEDDFPIDLNYSTEVHVIGINDDFIKVEYKKGKKQITKLIDIDLIKSIRVLEEDK